MVKKVGFGRAVSEPGNAKAGEKFQSTGYLTLNDKPKEANKVHQNG